MSSDPSPEHAHALRRGRWQAWFPMVLAVATLAGLFLFGAVLYPELPDPMPTHFDAAGRPDAWEPKSFSSVFLPVMISAGAVGLMALVAAIAPALSVSPKDPSDWRRFQVEGSSRGIRAALGWIGLLTALFIGLLAIAGWTETTFPLALPLAVYLVLVLVACVLPFRRWRAWAVSAASAEGVHPSESEAAEERLWLAGGIYNDPSEPRILVPKREGHGTGLTINVGHRRGKRVVIVFLVITVGLPTLLILIAGLG